MTDISGSNTVSDGSTRHYTPTTEEVRDQYCLDDGLRYTEHEAGFDRWLAEVKAQVWADGYTAGTHDWRTESLTTPNPYRQGETE